MEKTDGYFYRCLEGETVQERLKKGYQRKDVSKIDLVGERGAQCLWNYSKWLLCWRSNLESFEPRLEAHNCKCEGVIQSR